MGIWRTRNPRLPAGDASLGTSSMKKELARATHGNATGNPRCPETLEKACFLLKRSAGVDLNDTPIAAHTCASSFHPRFAFEFSISGPSQPENYPVLLLPPPASTSATSQLSKKGAKPANPPQHVGAVRTMGGAGPAVPGYPGVTLLPALGKEQNQVGLCSSKPWGYWWVGALRSSAGRDGRCRVALP